MPGGGGMGALRHAARKRIKRGWSANTAVTTKSDRSKPHYKAAGVEE